MAFNRVGHGILILDHDGCIIDTNPAADAVLGGVDSDLLNRPVWEIVSRGEAADTLRRTITEQKDREATYVTVATTNGENELAVTPVEDITGAIAYYLVEIDTPTAGESPAVSDESTTDLEGFSRTLAHEIRSPLSIAMGYAELASDAVEMEELDHLTEALERIDQLLDDMVNLASNGSYVDERTDVDLARVAKRAWRSVASGDADLRISSTESVSADETRLLQVLENLFRNAVEHGGDDVTVRIGVFDGGFFVEDDGNGIPSEHRSEVFETGVSLASGGTGLGLSIVRNIVEAHGWDITVTEGDDGGARFEILTE